MPVAALLQSCNGTVQVVHSRTKDIPDKVKRADIIVAAIGKPEFVRGEWLKPGAVVIDVGINSKDDPTKKRGYRLVGDVHYDECAKVASAITPVPGKRDIRRKIELVGGWKSQKVRQNTHHWHCRLRHHFCCHFCCLKVE